MSKSVLTVDTPETCKKCVLYCIHENACKITGLHIKTIDIRPKCCPLKECYVSTNSKYTACFDKEYLKTR